MKPFMFITSFFFNTHKHTHTHTQIPMVEHPLCRCQGNKRKMTFESSQVSVAELMGRAENRVSYR